MKPVLRAGAVTTLTLLAAIAPSAPAGAASPGPLVPLLTRLQQLPAGVLALGAALPSAPARALISLRDRDTSGLERFIASVSDPASRNYGHYLTPVQFGARFAPSAATVAQVEAYARSFGLRVAEVPANRAYVLVTGTVGAAERAFGTRITRYSVAGRTATAPAAPLRVPASLASSILEVTGLDTVHVETPLAGPPAAFVEAPPCAPYAGQPSSAPAVPGASAPPSVVPCGYTPEQLRSAYGFAPALAAGLDGRGQTVAVIDAYSSPTIRGDVQTYSARHGLPSPDLVVNDNSTQRNALQIPPLLAPIPFGLPGIGDPQGWTGEETLDVEAIHAMAPAARVIYQGADSDQQTDLERAQNAVVQADQAQIISNSYGAAGDVTDPTSDKAWMQAAAEGIGVYFASGDNGDETAGTGDLTQRATDGGANSPYVTAVGGTSLGVAASGRYSFESYWGTYQSTFSGGGYSPAPPGTFLYGGGGGTSQVYAEPSYQAGVVPDRFAKFWQGKAQAAQGGKVPGRVVPDVAIDADPQTGLVIGLTQDYDAYKNSVLGTLPTDTNIGYGEYRIGGTSLASPLFAGLMALADQAAGHRHGFTNPLFYSAHGAFRDIIAPSSAITFLRTDYVNQTNASGGTKQTLRLTGQTVSLTSAPGFDDTTGLGTPLGLGFLHALAPGSTTVTSLLARFGADGAGVVSRHKHTPKPKPKARKKPKRKHKPSTHSRSAAPAPKRKGGPQPPRLH